jgi:hypothetical protein
MDRGCQLDRRRHDRESIEQAANERNQREQRQRHAVAEDDATKREHA